MKKKAKEPFIIRPANDAQNLFMTSDADITLASGSAGSSKSYGILLRFLNVINDPHTTGLIIRKNFGQLNQPGGLWSEAITLYSQCDPGLKINQKNMKLTFSSGAILQFSGLEDEKARLKWLGSQISWLALDEAIEQSLETFTFLLSRVRNSKVKYKPSVCMATNPTYDHWLREWAWWWLDPLTGIPDPKKRGIKRYFVRVNNEMIWADTRQELEAIYGTGDDNGIMSFCAIGSTCLENPYIDQAYVSRLKALSHVMVARYLYGSWTARDESANYFKRIWCKVIPYPEDRVVKRVRAWDLAGVEASQSNPDPDWSVGVLMAKTSSGRYIIEDIVRLRGRFHTVEKKMFEVAENDGSDVTVVVPRDAGAAGLAYASSLIQKFSSKGLYAKMKPTNKSKLDRFRPFSAVAEAFLVDVVEADWNKVFFDELEAFSGDGKGHDDMVDAVSDAYASLRSSIELPNFTLPDLSRQSGFDMSRSLGIA